MDCISIPREVHSRVYLHNNLQYRRQKGYVPPTVASPTGRSRRAENSRRNQPIIEP
ncbi:hypothetical protein BDV59DRAFT_184848 [Aspergillus ambiguus]|uniref:uncharacterized protein n=1 Tax=Aspergillus ambiguus TaxID=176160 RepID=UPI003CCDD16F